MKINSARFAGSSSKVDGRPSPRLSEFAFIGRSNVGKSSLVNSICGNSRIAMTSSKPGKTRTVNHFLINGLWYLVDLPGYGYAKASMKDKAAIEDVIRDYLNHSGELRELFVLIDSRHNLVSTDADFLKEIGGSDIPFSIIFTKADKSGPVACERQVEALKEQIAAVVGHVPSCFVTSAEKGTGRDDVLNHIENILTTE